MAERPTTCANCGKRLSKKQHYYRNGQFFCQKRCWVTAQEKAAQEAPASGTEQPTKETKEAASTG